MRSRYSSTRVRDPPAGTWCVVYACIGGSDRSRARATAAATNSFFTSLRPRGALSRCCSAPISAASPVVSCVAPLPHPAARTGPTIGGSAFAFIGGECGKAVAVTAVLYRVARPKEKWDCRKRIKTFSTWKWGYWAERHFCLAGSLTLPAEQRSSGPPCLVAGFLGRMAGYNLLFRLCGSIRPTREKPDRVAPRGST